MLSGSEIAATGAWIAAIQSHDGLIPWSVGGPADPWNHVEGAMALDVACRHDDARRAYEYLLGRQRSDGAFDADLNGADLGRTDTNTVAYVAAGILHHTLSTGDVDFARRSLPMVDGALDFVLDRQLPGGAVAWCVDPDGTAPQIALVAGSSSIALSLRCAAALAPLCGVDGARWVSAADEVAASVRERRSQFFDKSEFAMDWYYPTIGGAVAGHDALKQLHAGAEAFVTADGVRCRSDGRWVTTAESAEASMAYTVAGDRRTGRRMLVTTMDKRRDHGAYLTGLVYPERSQFPPDEETTYSAAAVLLADDLLSGGTATDAVFAQARTSMRNEPTTPRGSSVNLPDAMASR